ncbi:hypothetical protein K1X12_04605 [Hyphomonas sp. WL0036]|uniref:hypothetical protein n=1 Tax=Hyphomonas sediminis TaxID=2866160 RepID=UPI001C811556|nr:hypothetical protein [Hyphomonas sediminis]MBY9066167.1 hypothetical protein [Hyphomonas sediminis]
MTETDPLRALWAGQATPEFAMTPEALRQKAGGFQRTIRLRNITEYAAAIFVVGVFGWMAFLIPEPVVKLGCALIVAGTLYVCWKLYHVASAAGRKQLDAALSLTAFHRAELTRQRDALATVWRWYLLPFVPGVLVFLGGVAFTPANPAPLAAKLMMFLVEIGFCGVMFAAIAWLNARAVKGLDAELAALAEAEGE